MAVRKKKARGRPAKKKKKVAKKKRGRPRKVLTIHDTTNRFYVRLDKKLAKALKADSEQAKRSVSSQLAMIVEAYYRHRGEA